MKRYELLFCFSFVWAGKLPAQIPLCHRSQPDFVECVAKNMGIGLRAFAQGNKELGLPPLDPYFIEKLEILPEPGKTLSLQQTYTNLYVHGMTNSEVTHMEIDFDPGCSWIMDVFSPEVRLEGDYQLKGNILAFPLNAHGKANISQISLRNRHSMWCEKYQKNGKMHVRVTNYTMDMHPEALKYYFQDVFPANKQIEDEISKTVNENGLSIFNEIRGAYQRIFSLIHIRLTNIVTAKIPFDEVFLP